MLDFFKSSDAAAANPANENRAWSEAAISAQTSGLSMLNPRSDKTTNMPAQLDVPPLFGSHENHALHDSVPNKAIHDSAAHKTVHKKGAAHHEHAENRNAGDTHIKKVDLDHLTSSQRLDAMNHPNTVVATQGEELIKKVRS